MVGWYPGIVVKFQKQPSYRDNTFFVVEPELIGYAALSFYSPEHPIKELL